MYFLKKYPDQKKFAPTFMKTLYEQELFSEEFLLKWHSKKKKLDRHCKLYDRKCEKAFRELINEFILWIQSAEVGEGDEEEDEEDEE